MAKRKRLDVPKDTIPADLETKSQAITPRARMPIAEVASEVAGRAALEEVARAMTAAETQGRVIKSLPIADIAVHHLARDRMVLDEDDMEALTASIAERGQQTPVEVIHLSGRQHGLISGLRRIEALRRLGEDSVLALVRRPETAEAAYRAMVEENEIRANLSFFERANIAVAAVQQGVYRSPKDAVAGLFAHAPAAKRSKIIKFVTIHARLGKALTFPTAIPEKLGLALAKALENDPKLAVRITDALRKTPPEDAAAERRTIERALRKQPKSRTEPQKLAKGLSWQGKPGRVVLSGEGVTEEFLEALRDFAVSHTKAKAE